MLLFLDVFCFILYMSTSSYGRYKPFERHQTLSVNLSVPVVVLKMFLLEPSILLLKSQLVL